jgi:selenocysteine lyase/cysteine desulfurase
MDCDFLTCSAYKFYGPHVSVFYGKKDLLDSIDFPRLEPAPAAAPERVEMGTLNHEGIAGAAAAVDFYAALVAHGAGSKSVRTGSSSDRASVSELTRRGALISAFAGLQSHSEPLVRKLWDNLSQIKGVRLYGPPPERERTPTVSFVVNGVASTEVARKLSKRGLFVSHGDFYAQTVIERLDLQPEGLVRVGCACYTSDEEVERLIEAIKELRNE